MIDTKHHPGQILNPTIGSIRIGHVAKDSASGRRSGPPDRVHSGLCRIWTVAGEPDVSGFRRLCRVAEVYMFDHEDVTDRLCQPVEAQRPGRDGRDRAARVAAGTEYPAAMAAVADSESVITSPEKCN